MKELSILLMGMSLIFMFVIAVVLVLYVLAYWMIFRKADTVLRHLYRV